MNFLLDENIPDEFKKKLKSVGYKAESANTKRFKGMTDRQLLDYAMRNKMTIISFDADFCNFKKENHFGIIKISGKVLKPLDVLLEFLDLYKDMSFKDIFVQIDRNKAYIESKVFSKKNKFKQFKKIPIKLKTLIK